MEVLKCQRPPKSSVMRRMVWCSLRWTLRAAGERAPDCFARKRFFDSARLMPRCAQDETFRNSRSFDSAPCGRFAQDDGVCTICIPRHEAIHARQEAADAFQSRVLPIQIAIGRRGEQRVHARSVGAVLRHHVVGRHHVAEILRHLGAALDHHSLSKQPLDRLGILHQPDVAHESSSRSASRSGAGWRARLRRCTDRWGTNRPRRSRQVERCRWRGLV